MISIPWPAAVALFWFGAFAEACMSNAIGRASHPTTLLADALAILVLLSAAKAIKR